MIHVIIGVGAAGITAAKTIRENDPDAAITMISTDEHVHSRCMLHRYLSHERNEDTLSFVEPDFFETYRIQWRNGVSVRTIDTAEQVVVLNDNTCCSYDRLLIATGANSFIPPVGQFREANNVFGLRHLSDAQAIRSLAVQANRILVVGSGLVGMDAAYAVFRAGERCNRCRDGRPHSSDPAERDRRQCVQNFIRITWLQISSRRKKHQRHI